MNLAVVLKVILHIVSFFVCDLKVKVELVFYII